MDNYTNKTINNIHHGVSSLPVKRNLSSGFVIVTVLWVVILLGVIAAAIGRSSRLDTKVSLANIHALKLRWACAAGIDTAMAVLNEDDKSSDSLRELWSENEDDFNNIELDGCCFNVQIVDEAGKLNINTATKKQLLGLVDMTEDLADSIIDWRDSDNTPGQAGAEGPYYESLLYSYKIRNASFKTIRELLLVRGFDAELLYDQKIRWIDYLTCYSQDSNTNAAGEKRININQADENKLTESLKIAKSYAKWIVENRPQGNGYASIADLVNDNSPQRVEKKSDNNSDKAEPLDLETFYSIADKITITNNEKIPGRVNINTAPREVLIALLEGGKDAELLADNIIKYRKTLISGMETIVDIMKVSSMKLATFKKIANDITTRSDIYLVNSSASITQDTRASARLHCEAVLDRSTSPNTVLYCYQGVSN
ncbi:MAG TPA: type II secretion system protein GspK [Sedimentisphaerales bacterium]|nr:type II secretion system protein GspK [Sedimentisphaerales bacterium]